jgi:hypothetical protein
VVGDEGPDDDTTIAAPFSLLNEEGNEKLVEVGDWEP